MGFFRFRRRVKILPGLWLNLSKGGVSTSVGIRGLTANFGRRGTKVTASLPGTGLSYSETAKNEPGSRSGNLPLLLVALVLLVLLAILLS